MELKEDQIDALTEIINIGIGKAAKILNDLTESHIILKVPSIEFFKMSEMDRVEDRYGVSNVAAVIQGFHGNYDGRAALIFPPESALVLVAGITGEEPDGDDLDAIQAGTLSEIGNIVINALIGTIANQLDSHLNFELSEYLLATIPNLFGTENGKSSDALLLISEVQFLIEKMDIKGHIILTFDTNDFEILFGLIKDKFLD